MEEISKIKEDLKNTLSEYRYNHSLRVAEEAQKLARCYNIDEQKAYLAGLVHDIAKEYSEEENKQIVEKYNLSNELLQKENKKNLHADIGFIIAKEQYKLPDEICNAIKYHTFGDVNMSLLDIIIFVADKIEPGKKYDGIEEERKLAYIDIKKSMIMCIENKIKKLTRENKYINPRTIEVLNYLKNSKKNISNIWKINFIRKIQNINIHNIFDEATN